MISKLIIKNNSHLKNKGVSYLEISKFDLMNIFIGKNGHGKSTILKQLNLNPPDNSDYEADGYRYIEKIFKGKVYQLESFTGSKSKHSFKIDNGPELNTGGTQAVQKELVKQYFQMTTQHFNILTAINENYRFTALSVADRKLFLMDIYPNDTKYALIVYAKLKSAYSDTIGAIKNQSQRLVEELQRVKTLGERSKEELLSDISKLDKRINEIVFVQGELNQVKGLEGDLRAEVELFNKRVKGLLTLGLSTGLQSKPELIRNIESLKGTIVYHETQQKIYQEQLNEIASALSGLEFKEHNPEQFETQLRDLEFQQALLGEYFEDTEEQFIRHPFVADHKDKLLSLTDSYSELIERINLVPLCSSSSLTTSIFTKYLERSEYLVNQGRNLTHELTHINHQLKHYESADEVNCPKCSTGFKPGFDKAEIEKLKRKELEYQNTVQDLRNEYKQLKTKITLDQEWFTQMTALERYLSHHNEGKFLLSLLGEFEVGYKDSDKLVNLLKTLVEWTKNNKRLIALTEEVNVLKSRINVFKANNMEETLKSFGLYEDRLAQSNTSLHRCLSLMKTYQKSLDDFNHYELTLEGVREGQTRLLELLKEDGRVGLRSALNNLMGELLPRKDALMSLMIRQESLTMLVSSIEENLNHLKTRQQRLKLLMDGLCPKKGYIGELMKEFITSLCGNMNAIIREIWSTPLYIKPCINDKDEVDYNFPVINGESEKTAGDVSLCSGGEKEIINFAFRLVIGRYIDCEPELFLDEVGVNMDEYHRSRFFDYVKRLMTTGKIDQCFMISHYTAQYGLMDNANIVALNTEGLTTPPTTNTHVTIR